MQKFRYTAVNMLNKKVRGIYLAANEEELRFQLAKQKLYLIKAKKAPEKTQASFFRFPARLSPQKGTLSAVSLPL